ncbi:hypothetical protein [Halobaculum gomorrense]|uniref:Uncharacterized protein n=1 Tax=Halobaculum gomorrense TaxID=43928 RepID=A0A1M5SC82_9EURY|nr:hypothetical protein [Halobaculum gomorrense]SHH36071.1 hypothetical protein SAMN05443636_2412 [Halobaculum gomorrense]
MGDPVNQILGTVLHRTILVAAVLVVMKFVAAGVYIPAIALLVPLAVFAYIRLSDRAVLR